MAVSDLSLVRHLIQATESGQEPLRWRCRGPCEFRAQLNGVRLSLAHMQSREGSRLCLCLSDGSERTRIEEPRNEALFGTRYRGEEERLLAESLQLLMELVAGRCASKKARSWDLRDSVRDSLFNRILFGKP